MIDRAEITVGYLHACDDLETFLALAGDAELRSRSAGTRWTNEELLFHMVFGYMVTRRLLPLVKCLGRLPPSVGNAFAGLLDAGTKPFDWVNYWGSWAASRVYNRHRMARKLRRVTTTLAANLETESHASLGLQMAFPTRWDPFFRPVMTVADLYAYPTKHFAFHAQQLSFLPHTPE